MASAAMGARPVRRPSWPRIGLFLALLALPGIALSWIHRAFPFVRPVQGAYGAVVLSPLRTFAAIATVFMLAGAGWVFFLTGTMGDAIAAFSALANLLTFRLGQIWSLVLPRFEMMVALGAIVMLLAVEPLVEHAPHWCRRVWASTPARWWLCIAQLYALLCFGVFREVEFIYFQF